MAYLDASAHRPNPRAVAGVIAIHAALGFVVVTGLATSVATIIDTGPMPTREWRDPPPPPPQPDDPKPQPKQAQDPADRKVNTPLPPIDLTYAEPKIETDIGPIKPFDDLILDPGKGTDFVKPTPTPAPGRNPISAAPRNNPGSWVTTNDYPSIAIRLEQEGTTGFKVTVGADGRVLDCMVTQSSGHPALDSATCKNVTRRARFKPAMDGFGEKTAGSYSSSVRWQLPD